VLNIITGLQQYGENPQVALSEVCRMKTRNIMESAEALLFICLIFALVLSAFIFFFVFCINWEDWFFGTKLDGLPAGLWLFAKMATAVAIVYLMAHYPRYRRQSVLAVSGYYGFLCFDSFVTIQKNTQGRDYPVMMAALFFISVLLLIVHGTLALTGAGDRAETETS
jgi:hypothetical protein